jgi:hypothetical protein
MPPLHPAIDAPIFRENMQCSLSKILTGGQSGAT